LQEERKGSGDQFIGTTTSGSLGGWRDDIAGVYSIF